ncbi:MAG: hypothetical protein JWO38_8340, partial [Gemmataceae bacterium]|nr:hypothetical protein [Gemmataceae bacterium]
MGVDQTRATDVGKVLAAAKARVAVDLRGVHG